MYTSVVRCYTCVYVYQVFSVTLVYMYVRRKVLQLCICISVVKCYTCVYVYQS